MNSNSPQARLFVPDALIAGVTIEPTKDQQHYLMTVMRLKDGAGVALFNGRDGEWFATLEATGKRTLSLMVPRSAPQRQTARICGSCLRR